MTIVRNRAIDQIRRDRARRSDVALDDAWMQPAATNVPDDALRRVDAGALRAAVARLPHEQQRALTLAHLHGFSMSQVASITGVPVGTVKSRVRLAIERLQRDTELAWHTALERPAPAATPGKPTRARIVTLRRWNADDRAPGPERFTTARSA